MEGSHAVAVLTEWEQFRDYDYNRVFATMPKPACIFDGESVRVHASVCLSVCLSVCASMYVSVSVFVSTCV